MGDAYWKGGTSTDPTVAGNWVDSGGSAFGSVPDTNDNIKFDSKADKNCVFTSTATYLSIEIISTFDKVLYINGTTVTVTANPGLQAAATRKIASTGSGIIKFTGTGDGDKAWFDYHSTTDIYNSDGMFQSKISRKNITFQIEPSGGCNVCFHDGVWPNISIVAGGNAVTLSPVAITNRFPSNGYSIVDIFNLTVDAGCEIVPHIDATVADIDKVFRIRGQLTISSNQFFMGNTELRLTPWGAGSVFPVYGAVSTYGTGDGSSTSKVFKSKFHNIVIEPNEDTLTHYFSLPKGTILSCNNLEIKTDAKIYGPYGSGTIEGAEIHSVNRPTVHGDWNFTQVGDGIYRSIDTLPSIGPQFGGTGLSAIGKQGQVLAVKTGGTELEWSSTAGGGGDAFDSIAVSGQDSLAASAGDDLTLVAAGGMTITTNAGTDTITFSSADNNDNTQNAYAISAVDGDNTDEEKIRLTQSGAAGNATDDVVLEAGTGLSIARSGDKITFANTVSDTNTNQLTTFTLKGTTNTTPTTVNHNDTITIAAGTGITTTSTSDGTITIANTVTDTNTTTTADVLAALNADWGAGKTFGTQSDDTATFTGPITSTAGTFTGSTFGTSANNKVTVDEGNSRIHLRTNGGDRLTVYNNGVISISGALNVDNVNLDDKKIMVNPTAHNAGGNALTVSGGDTTAGTTDNIAGGNLILEGGQGKGTGAGGNIVFKVADGGNSGDQLNSLATALTIFDNTNATFANDLTISGNLTVSGSTTTIDTNIVNIGDSIITLNSDETGTPSQDGGIEIERGTSTNKSFFWDESEDKWSIGSETMVAGTFEGALTGNVTGNVSGTAATVTGAAQTNITSLGTLTALTGGTGDLIWDTPTFVVDSSANNVGIGTTSPGHKLHVTSPPDDSGDYAIYADEGSDNYAALVNRHSNNRRTALFYRNINASYTAKPMVEIHQDHASDDQAALYIQQDGSGPALSVADTSTLGIILAGTATSDGVIADISFRNAADSIGAIQMHRVSNNSQGDMTFHTQPNGGNVTERMRIDSTGKVGIGTTTPLGNLVIANTGEINVSLLFRTEDGNGGTSDYSSYGIVSGWESGETNWTQSYLKFNHVTANNTYVNTMTMKGPKVGIGTTSPDTNLHIAGSSHQMLTLERQTQSADYWSGIEFQLGDDASATAGHIYGIIGGAIEDPATGSKDGALVFHTSLANTTSEKMRITSGGSIELSNGTPATPAADHVRMTEDGGYLKVNTPSGYISIGPGSSSWGHILTDRAKFYFNKPLVVAGGNTSGNAYTISSYSDADLVLATQSGAENRITIKSDDGHVGIGTTSPSALLHLKGASGEGMPLRLHRPHAGGANYGVGMEFVMGETGDASAERVYGELSMAMDGVNGNAAGGSAHDGYFAIRPSLNGTPTERMRVLSNGKVAIGSTSATATLDVTVVGGNTTTSGIAFGDASKGYLAAGSSFVSFATNDGTTRIAIDNGGANVGNVGIGTTEPAAMLDIHSTSGNQLRLSYDANYYWQIERDNNGDLNFINHNNTSDVTAMHLDSSTNRVGIGTTSPQAPLHVVGNVMIANTDSAGTKDARILGRTNSNNDYNLIYGYANASTNRTYIGGGTSTGEPSSHIYFYTGAKSEGTDAAGDKRMEIEPAGDVIIYEKLGIANANPSSALDVTGSVEISSNLFFNGAGNHYIKHSSGTASSDSFTFRFSDNEDVMIVRGDGRVGIKTTAPEAELHVEGSLAVAYALAHAGQTGQNRLIFGTNTQTYQTAGTDRLTIAADGAVTVAGAFAAATKEFVIEHPTKPNMKLHHGSLEGPEHAVYIRGKNNSGTIHLPDYWEGLVDEDSITVQLTAIGNPQELFVRSISNGKVRIAAKSRGKHLEYFYFIQAERKDVDKLVVEY